MFKVIIVDDEAMIRKGLKNVIDWQSLECNVIDEASDGIEGIEKIAKHLPDILITDIKMPGMNGLEMIKEARKHAPECKIIVLTGHRDFDYVHEAIKLGVINFVLKPTKIQELTQIIKKVVTKLKLQKQKDNEYEKFKVLFEENLPVVREKFLYDVLNGIITDKNLIIQQKELFSIDIDSYLLVLVDNENKKTGQSQYENQLHRFGIVNTFCELNEEKYKVNTININYSQTCFIVYNNSDQIDFIEGVSRLCEDLMEIINNCFCIDAVISISNIGESITQLSERYSECKEAMARKIYLGDNSVIRYNDVKQFANFKDNSMLEAVQKKLIDSVKSGNVSSVEVALNAISNYVEQYGKTEFDYLKDFYFNTIASLNNIRITLKIKASEFETRNIGGLYNLIQKCEDVNELSIILSDVSYDISKKVNDFNTNSIKSSIVKALDFIKENYKHQITLNDVSEHIFLSTYYVSRMFKKELGKNFIDILNECRIDSAKSLLKSTDYKTYEIADMVGINDPHYFSKIFKKYVGVTPTQYREGIN